MSKTSKKVPWFPDQKGAWAMVIVPFWTGVAAGGFHWQHIILFLLWCSGYGFFFTAENWLHARRRPNYRPPVVGWAIATGILGLITLAVAGALWPWLLWFLPLALIVAVHALSGGDRSLLARSATVLSAALMAIIAWDLSVRAGAGSLSLFAPDVLSSPWYPVLAGPSATRALAVTAALAYYFWSTIPYVKSILRERKTRGYGVFVVLVHAAGLIAAIVAALTGILSWWLPAMWVILSARAAYFLYLGRYRKGSAVNAKKLVITLGVVETVISIFYAAATLA